MFKICALQYIVRKLIYFRITHYYYTVDFIIIIRQIFSYRILNEI